MLKAVISLEEVDNIFGGQLLKGLGLCQSLHFSLGILMLISNGRILYTHKIIALMVRLLTKRVLLSGMLPFLGKDMKVVSLSIYWTLETRKKFLSLLSHMVK